MPDALAKTIASREYRKKHNYMDNPGDTKMPEYSSDEINDIEDPTLKQREIAQKHGRSICGIQSKKYRMKYGSRIRAKYHAKKEFYDKFIKGKELPKKEVKPITQEDLNIADQLLHGEIDINAFLAI